MIFNIYCCKGMILRLSGSHTIGKDLDGDGLPDIPLIYDMEEGSRIEFPLNFCSTSPHLWKRFLRNNGSSYMKELSILILML